MARLRPWEAPDATDAQRAALELLCRIAEARWGWQQSQEFYLWRLVGLDLDAQTLAAYFDDSKTARDLVGLERPLVKICDRGRVLRWLSRQQEEKKEPVRAAAPPQSAPPAAPKPAQPPAAPQVAKTGAAPGRADIATIGECMAKLRNQWKQPAE